MLALVRERGLRAVIVNPSTPVGPRDIKPTPTGKMIADGAAGRLPAYLDTGLNIVHVDDVAEGHILALERGRDGERYILGGEDFLLREVLAMVAKAAGRRPPGVRLHESVTVAGGAGLRGIGPDRRHRAGGDPGYVAHGAQEDVFLVRQGARRARLRTAAGDGGNQRRGCLVPCQRHGAGVTLCAALAVLIWGYLALCHGQFWQAGPFLPDARPSVTPAVSVVVPARDEAPVIASCLASLLAQDYAGKLRVILVDDRSGDGTGAIARAIIDPRLTVIAGREKPAGWSGKLWAVAQGIAATEDALILLTDADIVHQTGHVGALVAHAESRQLDLLSEMVILNTDSFAERALVPAFVFFFQLLYPFARVNDPRRATAAAAGGTILLRRAALARIGGIAAIRGALIDDVTLARAVKRGGAIWLGHSRLARSLRPYPAAGDVWRMVARTAFVQLRHSWTLLALTTLGMALTWLVPPVAALFGHGLARALGLCAWAVSAACYLPTLRRAGRSPLWAPFLPLVAAFYMAATIGSALDHLSGRGAVWKQRSYTDARNWGRQA